MKPKYEISVWEDVLSEDGKSFNEKKIIVIGSDTMTSESRAREPKLVTNINGTNKFTFNMYYSYIDTRTGERVKNPYIKYLINERKIKVLWKDQWYDLLIKQIKEDQVQHLFSYTCEDAYITELSRTGFELTFATELENNIGTAKELIEKVIENTDWRFDEKSDSIYQQTEEPVYETTTILTNATEGGIWLTPDTKTEAILVRKEMPILVYYSCAPDPTSLNLTGTSTSIQFYYSDSTIWEQDENDMLVTNGNSFTINVTWRMESDTVAVAQRGSLDIFRINFGSGLSTRYRAKRYVQSQKTIYNSIVDRYVNVYNDGELLGYNTTEYNDALAVVNLFTNANNFQNTSGWKGSEDFYFKLSPGFNSTTVVSEYKATSFLYIPQGCTFNTGIQDNRPYIPNGFIKGERYILRLKLKYDGDEPANTAYLTDPNSIKPSIQGRKPTTYTPNNTYYFKIDPNHSFYDDVNNWLEYDMICTKSCPYENILSTREPFGLFLETTSNYWLEEAQFYREVFGEDAEGNKVRIDPNQMSYQSIAQTYWKYFSAKQDEGTTANNLVYEHISLDEWSQAQPVYNDFERYGTIEADNSNRFNILQTIAESFECWVKFEIEHDDNGYIEYEDGLPKKWIRLERETGQETGIGFIYGIDLKGIVRNIKSDKISTKTIVQQNENEFGKNGFCSIARSEQNYPRENFIYNFDYYIQHGLMDRNALYDDLYNTTGLNYYTNLHLKNVEYAKNLEFLTNKKLEFTKQKATATIYNQYILSIEEELKTVNESIMKLASVTTINDGLEYAKTHSKDNKIQSLVNDHYLLEEQLRIYRKLQIDLQQSIDTLEESIINKENRQSEIINELTILNKQFYIKYSRFIQEGTWTSEDYWDDDLYYLDAIQVAYQSSRPQISYEINVLRLSDIEDFRSKIFKLGDISFIQDVEYFGYKEDKITPYKERVVLTEITSYFDTPDKDTIKVQNYKSQFDDLFQRITATVQNLELTEGKYAKAANIVTTDGTIRSSVIQNTFNENKDLVYGAQNESATIDNTGITVTDNANAAKQVKVTSGGVFVTNDGGNTWKNAIRGDGISADVVTTGKLNTELISIYGNDAPSFVWDAYGINAYMLDEGGHVATYIEDDTVTPETFNNNVYYKKIDDQYIIAEYYEPNVTYYLQTDYESNYREVEDITAENFISNYYYYKNENDEYILAPNFIEGTKYYTATRSAQYNQCVRFDKYGIYGIKNKANYRPISESQIYNDANFGLTWNKFFMKSSNGDKSIEISTDRDIVVTSGNVERIIIGRVDGSLSDNYGIRIRNNDSDVIFQCDNEGSYLSGWTLTKECLQSELTATGQSIKIYADGNIGCYGTDATTYTEAVYSDSPDLGLNVITDFPGIGLNTNSRSINAGEKIFPFVSSIRKIKTQLQVSEKENKPSYKVPTGDLIPSPPSTIQIAIKQGNETHNFNIEDIVWSVNPTQPEFNPTIITDINGNKTYVYTYTFDLTAKNSAGEILFSVPYTTNFDTYQDRYVPASKTKWSIDNEGYAVFHNIQADGGVIAGWFIDNEKIYQTTNGKPDGPIKTQLNSQGMASSGGIDYSILTDAISAAVASIAGMYMSHGLINGYSIAAIAAQAANAQATADSAKSTAEKAQTSVNDLQAAYSHHKHSYKITDRSSGWAGDVQAIVFADTTKDGGSTGGPD